MALSGSVAIKFDVYTLACHELLSRLPGLELATRRDRRIDFHTFLLQFDKSLDRFFRRATASTRSRAAQQLGGLLRAEAEMFRDSNESAAALLDEVAESLGARISSWHHREDLDRFHRLGHELARRFYSDSPWPVTRERLGLQCDLEIEYGGPDEDDWVALRAQPLGYEYAPVAYYESYQDHTLKRERKHVLVVRFTFAFDFDLYLALPFMFLHEYTAHVYATDYKNEPFNDGWMLYAADAFLTPAHVWGSPPLELHYEQARAFVRLRGELGGFLYTAVSFAERFDSWLSVHMPGRFTQITYELAAFQPGPGESEGWPTAFIHVLADELNRDRERLLNRIRDAKDMRALMAMLAPI